MTYTNSRRSANNRFRRMIFTKTNGRCAYCGETLPDNWHMDHITPKAQGGQSVTENILASCPDCNGMKKAKDLEQFRHWLQNKLLGVAFSRHFGLYLNTIDHEKAEYISDQLEQIARKVEENKPVFYFEKMSSAP